MKKLALVAALAIALPATAEELLPPPPPPPDDGAPAAPAPAPAEAPPRRESRAYGDVPLPPPPPGTRPLGTGDRAGGALLPAPAERPRPPSPLRPVPGTIGEGPVAPAGSPAAPLHPDETISNWRFSLASGVIGRWGAHQISSDRANNTVLLYFGAQADGVWTEGYGQAARLRLRMITGGERDVYLPSDGEVEAAYMIGRPEFRFVIGRVEVGRYPGLQIQTLAQVATLPCFEGSLSLAHDTMRLYYYLSPIEASYVYYYGGAHIHHSAAWATESDRPSPATAVRLRYTAQVPPSVILSVQGDLVRMWGEPDLFLSAEGSAGYAVLDNTVLFNVAIRWNRYTRRGTLPQSEATDDDLSLLAIATLAF